MTDLEYSPPDRVVRRVNEITFTFLDAVGTLLVAAAVGWWAWEKSGPPAGLLLAGACVTILSVLGQARFNPRPPKVKARQRPHVPGPTDPGPVHIAGGQ